MATRIIQTIEDALSDVRVENGLSRIDVGITDHYHGKPYIVSIWFDAPEGVIGHAAEHGATIDEALTKALAEKNRKLAVRLAEAA